MAETEVSAPCAPRRTAPQVGALGCQTAMQPAVRPPLLTTDAEGRAIALSLDNANGGKRVQEALCHMGHIDHHYSVLVEPRHGWASVALAGGLASGAVVVCEPPTGWNRDPRIAELSNSKEVQWRLVGGGFGATADTPVGLANPVAIEITKSCYEFKGLKDEVARSLGQGAALQIKALTAKAVRFDHVIWHRAR